jgi:hypothetical protein
LILRSWAFNPKLRHNEYVCCGSCPQMLSNTQYFLQRSSHTFNATLWISLLVNWPIFAPINEEMVGNVLDHEWMIVFNQVTHTLLWPAYFTGVQNEWCKTISFTVCLSENDMENEVFWNNFVQVKITHFTRILHCEKSHVNIKFYNIIFHKEKLLILPC